MIRGHLTITKEDILQRVNERQLFQMYCENFKEYGVLFTSDIRPGDRHPSCSITDIGNGPRYKDFGLPDKAFDIWDYVGRKYGMTYVEVLDKVARDLNISPGLIPNQPIQQTQVIQKKGKMPAKLQIKRRSWLQCDKEYWYDGYMIPRLLLDAYNVVPITHYWFDGCMKYTELVAYSYNYYNYNGVFLRKIYQPLALDPLNKWRSNLNNTVVQGIANIPKTAPLLFITKSLKDIMVLRMMGYISVATNNEHCWLPEQVWEKFKLRYTKKVILFDNDTPGVKSANDFSLQYQIPFIQVPCEDGVKDPSDFVKKHKDLGGLKMLIERELKNV